MALRVIRKIFAFTLLGFLILLTSCDLNLNIKIPEPKNRDPQIMEIYEILDKYYYKNLPIDVNKVKSVEELLSFTDDYTYTFSTTRNIDMGNKYVGLGITIQDHQDGLFVAGINVLTETDKHLYVGDVITNVNDNNLSELSFDEKALLLKGQEGDEKNIKVKRFDEIVEVTLKLFEVPFDSISYYKKGDYGYIKILRFGGETDEDFSVALADLESQNINGLLIDVRDNGGGYLTSAVNILKIFINDTEPFLYLHYPRENAYQTYKNNPINEKAYPITILVNENSASASEVIAGTMQKYGHKLIGSKTYGKDLFQVSLKLESFPGETYLSFTQGYWLLNDKTSVSGGISPDVYYPQVGALSISYPVVYKEFNKGDSHPLIKSFQYLLSRTSPSIYEPGLFDDNLESMILTYQTTHGLTQTKRLDKETQLHLIDFYRSLIKNEVNDYQLNFALNNIE
ncbi:MAG: S41 family peptidase [Acholeplasmatales bacterium]